MVAGKIQDIRAPHPKAISYFDSFRCTRVCILGGFLLSPILRNRTSFVRLSRILLILLAGLIMSPALLVNLDSGVDGSFVIGLHLTALKGLGFGKAVVMPYGPLGYLAYPIYVEPALYWRAVATVVAAHFLLIVTLFFLIKRLVPSEVIRVVFFLPTLYLLFPFFDLQYKLILSALLLWYMVLANDIPRKGMLVLISFIQAIGALVTFTVAVVMGAFAIIGSYCLWAKQRRDESLLLFVGSVSFFVFLWWLSSGHDSSLMGYLKASIDFTASYAEIATLSGPIYDVVIASFSLVCGFWLVRSSYTVADQKLRDQLKPLIWLCLPLLYITFGYSFVRHDAHALRFFSTLGFLCIVFALLLFATQKRRATLAAVLAAVALLGTIRWGLGDHIHPAAVFARLRSNSRLAMLAAGGGWRFQLQEKQRLRDQLRVSDAIISAIQDVRADVVPSKKALVYAYDLGWMRDRVFSPYYVTKLDASFLERSPPAPKFVLFAFESIDGRYPLFDQPEIVRSLLCHYRPSVHDNKFVLLERQVASRCLSERLLATVEANVGDIIRIPEATDGYVLGRLRVQLSPIGSTMRALFKLPPQDIVLMEKEPCWGAPYRFTRTLAEDGLLLSGHVTSTNEVVDLFHGNVLHGLGGISIRAGSPLFYRKIRVDFYSLPMTGFKPNPKPAPDISPSSLDFYNLEPGFDSGHVDDMKGLIATGARVGKEDCVLLRGWARDPFTDKPAKDIVVAADKKILTRARRLGIEREDVARHFGNPALRYSGWEAGFPVSSVPEKSSRISVYAVLSDGRSVVQFPNPHSIIVTDATLPPGVVRWRDRRPNEF